MTLSSETSPLCVRECVSEEGERAELHQVLAFAQRRVHTEASLLLPAPYAAP
jgi:hypothetical protein